MHILSAIKYSIQGLKVAWQETAFKHHLLVLVPLSLLLLFLPFSIVLKAMLLASHIFALLVEVLNTAIEKVVDRIGDEYHPLLGDAKDLGSTAVMAAISIVVILWLGVIVDYFV